MKRKILILVAVIIGISSNLSAQVAVTFNVDMTGQTVDANGVHIAGNFNDFNYDGVAENAAYVNWSPYAIALSDQGNGIWKVTLNLVPERYEFKFINGNDWAGAEDVPQACQVEVNGNDNRFWSISGVNATESMTVCYASCAACGENTVRFRVDMTQESAGVNPLGVFVAGTFQGWNSAGSQLIDPDGNGTFEGYFSIGTATSTQFKFINGNDWAFAESVPGACAVSGNREINVTEANTVVDVTCFSACGPCQAPTPVLFRVDMSLQTVNANGPHVAGSFQQWNPADPNTLMLDPDGDNIYEVTLLIQPGTYQYEFVNGDAWVDGNESIPIECSGTGSREFTVGADPVVQEFCYEKCTLDCFTTNGCSDPLACNYDASSNNFINCTYPGCTEPSACNYNSVASCDDGSCFYNCGSTANSCNEIFISEVVEGWANNKAIEIYNPTNSTIDLTGYGLTRFANGSSIYGSISPLDGYSIAPHDVFVIVIDKQDPSGTGLEAPVWPELQAAADVFINPTYDNGVWPMYFTGNDAVALVKNNGQTLVDLYGRIGEGTNFGGWSAYGTDGSGATLYASKDHSQIRENWVTQGVTTNPSSFDVFAEYDVLGANTFDHLGWHNCNCNVFVPGCNDPQACNYNPSDVSASTCQYPGCTNTSACNYNANSGCDDGSCYNVNSPCNDNNPNTFNDVYTSSCNCSGSAFSYGNLDNNTVALCSGENTQIAMIYEPVGLPSYSLQWYYKSGVVNAPFGSSTAGWIAIPGATTSVVDVNSFVGSRTYACFVTTDGSMGLMSQWANGVSYVNYSSINAQAIIGNPNITPFNNYTYAVTALVGNTYNWTVTNGAVLSGQGTSVVSILWGQNGPYQVTLTESDGTCSGTSVLFAVNNNCTISVSAASATSTSFCSGASVQLQAATNATNITYQWYLNGVAIAGETNQNTAATLGGNYQVSITQNGCSAISQILAITELPGITMPTLVVDQANAGCSGSDATVSLTDANYSTITWSNGTVNTSSINVSESGSYSVTVSDNNGCTATSSAVDVNLSLVSVVPVCLVTVDQTTGKNNVVWEPVTSDMINSYVVLKETNVANVYAQIGTVAYGSNGLFEDVNANPQVQANRYKLALIDTCGILSSNSDFHKTIHLSTNQGLGNNVNLIWSGYEGFDFGSYNIYRGASAGTMTLLTTIASNLDSYTDINPPVGEVYYMIEVEGVSCDPQRTLVYSHSNVITTTTDGVEELSNAISLYPNPATASINLQVNSELVGQEYIVFDAIGKVIYKNKIQSTNEVIQLENFDNGNYFVKVNEVMKRFVVQH